MLSSKQLAFTLADEEAFTRIDNINRQDVSLQDAIMYVNLIDKAKAIGAFKTSSCFKGDLTERYTSRYLYFKKRYIDKMDGLGTLRPLEEETINKLKDMTPEGLCLWIASSLYKDSLPQGWLGQVILEVPMKPLITSHKASFVKSVLIGKYALIRKYVVRSKILKIDFNLSSVGDLYMMYKNFMNESYPGVEHKAQLAFKQWVKTWCCLDGPHKSYSSQRHKLTNPLTGTSQELEYFHLKDREDLKDTWVKLSKGVLEYTQEEEECSFCRLCFGDWKDQKSNQAVCESCLDKYLKVNKRVNREDLTRLSSK